MKSTLLCSIEEAPPDGRPAAPPPAGALGGGQSTFPARSTPTAATSSADLVTAARRGVPIAADTGSGSGGAGAGLQAAVHLLEHKVLAHLDAEEKEHVADSWVLDTGAMNHMSGSCAAFTELDAAVWGTIIF